MEVILSTYDTYNYLHMSFSSAYDGYNHFTCTSKCIEWNWS